MKDTLNRSQIIFGENLLALNVKTKLVLAAKQIC